MTTSAETTKALMECGLELDLGKELVGVTFDVNDLMASPILKEIIEGIDGTDMFDFAEDMYRVMTSENVAEELGKYIIGNTHDD